ncbi:IS4/IS5 family transposase [Methanofollis aquaemaris]|uniref:IS4/IS5 family transposase n=1 Tax=Methanofollis aquaemaris TaxID=126734 RepID=A0A8A3S6T8_9EURY|nr:transposase [Methanofollis aquaemaris]QSZ67858.1 IS4/IS5 family transposase [Methanofollis aquaemaris]
MFDRYEVYSRKKRGIIGFDDHKKIKENKLSVIVDRNGRPLSCVISPENSHDSTLYIQTLEGFTFFGNKFKPTFISADPAYDTIKIRAYNDQNRIKSNIQINTRNTEDPEKKRTVPFDPELYKKRGAIERFLSWIKAFKKIALRHERKEESFLGLIMFACES